MRSSETVDPKMSALIFRIRKLQKDSIFYLRSFLTGELNMRLLERANALILGS